MKGKLIAAVTIAFIVSLTVVFIGQQQEAKGQKQGKTHQLEYRVIYVPTSEFVTNTEGDFQKWLEKRVNDEIQNISKQFNELGADGWEYVGPVYQAPKPKPAGSNYVHAWKDGVFLAFKRPKN